MSNLVRLFMYGAFLCFTSFVYAAPLEDYEGSIPDKNFARLKDSLPTYESEAREPWSRIPFTDELIKPGDRGKIILALREHLLRSHDLSTDEDSGSEVFDHALVRAVKLFQWRHGLAADGIIGDDTKGELNVSPQAELRKIHLNMERWATLAREVRNRYLIVNIPEYQLHLIDNNSETLNMKVIVGRPERPTPELHSVITRFVLNPYWNVPELIAVKDIIPKILEDENYLDNMRIRIFASDDGSDEISPGEIDWHNMAANNFPYHFRQEPGPENALGLVKFEFNNSHSVYLHDTPAKNLFDNDSRDLSSGCVRLENPFGLVEYLTRDDTKISEDRIQQILEEQKTTYVKLKQPLPIFITYITAWVDDEGRMHFLKDIYGRDV